MRNGGVWKGIYREGWVKNGWETINAVKKRGKTRFFDLTTDKCVWCRPPAMALRRSGIYNPECTFEFRNIFSGLVRLWCSYGERGERLHFFVGRRTFRIV